jgi:hypothetical protein
MTEEIDQSALRAAKTLRRLLRMIVTEPADVRAPHHAIRRLRPFVDSARLGLQSRPESIGRSGDCAREQVHLVDGAVAGLCHIARFHADHRPDSIIPPFAAAGLRPRTRHRSECSGLELSFVVPEDVAARERADRMIAFVLIGISDLGFAMSHASCTPSRAASLAQLLTGRALTSRDIHFVWGCFSLYDDLFRSLPAADSQVEPPTP